LFAVADDVDAGIFLKFQRQQRGVVLGFRELAAFETPRRPKPVRRGKPCWLWQTAGDSSWKQSIADRVRRHGGPGGIGADDKRDVVSARNTLPEIASAVAIGSGGFLFWEGSLTNSESVPQLEFVFAARVTVDQPLDLGDVAKGGRRIVAITGGEFAGPQLRGAVLPGGADWQVLRHDGVAEL
jgi:hypothetical protein